MVCDPLSRAIQELAKEGGGLIASWEIARFTNLSNNVNTGSRR
jgi:hypothetical protein